MSNEVLVKEKAAVAVEQLFPKLSGKITKELLADPEFDAQLAVLLDIEAIVKDKMSNVKDGLKKVAEEEYKISGDGKIESMSYNASYKPAYPRNGVDSEKLETEYPEVYKKCLKTTVCSASITVKRKRG